MVSGGALVAAVTFIQNLPGGTVTSKGLFSVGFFALISSIIIQLLIPILHVKASGYYHDAMMKIDNSDEQREKDFNISQRDGKAAGIMLINATTLTIMGIIFLSVFTWFNL